MGNFEYDQKKKLFLPNNKIFLGGRFWCQLFREKRLIHEFDFTNGITNVGRNYGLNAIFNGGTQILAANWAIGLIDNASFGSLATADTMASHSWTEFTAYTQSTRPAWGPTTSTAQLVANVVLSVFDISSSGVLNGIFVTSNNTKGGTTGTLWATASYPTPVPVTGGTDEIKILYQVAA
jgi:hypothetical protein